MRCRLCGCDSTVSILNLGLAPLANDFLDSPESPEELFELDLHFCPKCNLVQITKEIPPERLFRNYFYFSSVSNSMLQHAKELADELIARKNLNSSSLVIELASNDGYALKNFVDKGIPVLGIDPAENVAKIAEAKGVTTLTEFFTEELARSLPKADVVIALNVLGHVPNPTSFIAGVRKILKHDGVAVFEVPSIRDMIENNSFDQVYHEHLNYYSLLSLQKLFKWGMMNLAKVEKISIHGGGYRLYVTHDFSTFDSQTNRMIEIETALGLGSLPYYQCFSNRVNDLKTMLQTLLNGLKNKRIVAYGGAAKGTMLLNYIGACGIEYVVDSTPAKIGKYLPGTHLKVKSPAELDNPDYVIITAHNWQKEIQSKHPEFEGRWILPIPVPRIV